MTQGHCYWISWCLCDLKIGRVNIRGHKRKCYLTTVTFWSKPLKFIVHFPDSSGFCSRLACLGLPYGIYSVTLLEINAKVKSIWELLAVRSRDESAADSLAALISSMQWFQWEWMTSAAESALGFWSIWWEVPEQEEREDSKTKVGTRL